MTCFLERIFSALKRNLIMLPCPWKMYVCACAHVCMHVYEFNSFRNLTPKCYISPNLTDYQLAQTSTKLFKRWTRVWLVCLLFSKWNKITVLIIHLISFLVLNIHHALQLRKKTFSILKHIILTKPSANVNM